MALNLIAAIIAMAVTQRDVTGLNFKNTNMEVLDGSKDTFLEDETKFYKDAVTYWEGIEPTVDGMLGGFGCVSSVDIKGSELFLKKIFNLKNGPGCKRALDCGAGIGRITKNLLIKYFDKVDLVEQNPKFLEVAKQFLNCEDRAGDFHMSSLQHFTPKKNFYDVIWCQWVLGHLTDPHLVDFLIRCKSGLKKNGVIVIKENVSSGDIVIHEDDSSFTRPTDAFLKVFKQANLSVFRHCKQGNFPKQLFCVKIFALRPNENEVKTLEEKKTENKN